MSDLIKRVESLRTLKNNWDSYGGRALSSETVDAGIRCANTILQKFPEVDEAFIFVAPARENEIHFEFILNNNIYFIVANSVK